MTASCWETSERDDPPGRVSSRIHNIFTLHTVGCSVFASVTLEVDLVTNGPTVNTDQVSVGLENLLV